MAKKNAFDDLLASIGDEQDRQVAAGLAEKYPILRESVLRQADYSRKMDELKDQVELAEQWRRWREENWVDNAYGEVGATKRELQKDALIEDLKGKLSELESKIQTGEEVTFSDLTAHIDKIAAEKKLVSQDVMEQRITAAATGATQRVDQMMAGFAKLAMVGPKLATRHYRTFNEDLDVEKLVEFANQNGYGDLDKAYDAFTADRTRELQEKAQKEREEEIRKQAREEAEKEFAARQPGRMPDDVDGGTDMGHFQAKMLGLKQGTETPADDNIPLGRGAIAARAAREWNANAD